MKRLIVFVILFSLLLLLIFLSSKSLLHGNILTREAIKEQFSKLKVSGLASKAISIKEGQLNYSMVNSRNEILDEIQGTYVGEIDNRYRSISIYYDSRQYRLLARVDQLGSDYRDLSTSVADSVVNIDRIGEYLLLFDNRKVNALKGIISNNILKKV